MSLYRLKPDADLNDFWAAEASSRVSWIKTWDKVMDADFHTGDIRWFLGAKLNVSYNCIDRHLPQYANKVAYIWEPDEPGQPRKITYQELYDAVNQFALVLKKLGVGKGDRVCIYMPMIPETIFAMLACARIGAIHSVVFAGFSPNSLVNRIQDAACRCVLTADEGKRGGKTIALKKQVDIALTECPTVTSVCVVKHTGNVEEWVAGRDHWYHDVASTVSGVCPPEPMDSEDPLFILYTSGSTGKPKGVLHTQGGYLVYASMTFDKVFGYQPNEVYWGAADVGWITGHSYIVYGPLANAATSVIYEGVPTHPTPSRCWEVVDKHQVNIIYTAPTVIRALMREGDDYVKKASRQSLRLLGSVGEPINPEAWKWYYTVVGDSRCPIVDTWWQTETGGIMITPFAADNSVKAGSATKPFFGIYPALVDKDGKFVEGEGEGELVITKPWPGMLRTVYGNHERFLKGYFAPHPGCFFTGDNARRDKDGDYWITGRVDDVINVSGHRLGTAEIESALVSHAAVAESAVVGMPHDLKGQGIYAFVTLKQGITPSDELKKALAQQVRDQIGGLAVPDIIQWAPQLPKTRSGKIMRRILRKIAEGDVSQLGDTSTLADPTVVDQLVAGRVGR